MRSISWTVTLAMFALAGCGSDVPPAPPPDAAAAAQQATAFVEAIKPRREGRPVIAVVARNEGTETTDFLLTHAVLQRAGIADVHAVAVRSGRVSLYPAFEIEVAQDLASFDQAYPNGADYVIVPAMNEPRMDATNGGAILTWLKQQSERGARIIGVCVGGLVVGNAGLLDDRRFTTHWYYLDELRENHPTAVYVPHQRYVIEDNIATTTGITASVPTMLSLVEAIGGREKAQALATEFGVESWTPVHDSSLFGLNFSRGLSFILNKMAFWRDEPMRVDVANGMDDITLAFTADAWSRTGHITVQAAAPAPVQLRSGITLLPSAATTDDAAALPLAPELKPMEQLDRTLCEIGSRFGTSRREWVMMELEYPGQPACDAKL
ncbi:DJ-1/PfpI family protein [Peristeroidobacter agariperforans]|uniref:DJ-1/PfpI family protein n=1 Tax=Peristeroidobacter agariperforans TaxID=268404 RepID=UPI00101E1CB7|nr:DJ-1/PfpI family protein [Peristeroidobacter agariperforans]